MALSSLIPHSAAFALGDYDSENRKSDPVTFAIFSRFLSAAAILGT